MIKIEKGVPVPGRKIIKRLPFDEIPWAQMEVGDSFVLVHTNASGLKNRAKRHGINILIKVISKDQSKRPTEFSYRVWRLEGETEK